MSPAMRGLCEASVGQRGSYFSGYIQPEYSRIDWDSEFLSDCWICLRKARGGYLHHFGKGAVEAGQRAESHRLGNLQDGIIRAPQQVAGLGDPGVVHEVQRGHAHDFPEDPAEMGGAPMAAT